ncbi:MAG: YdcF family protein [Elainellaceae cyanobacterium]
MSCEKIEAKVIIFKSIRWITQLLLLLVVIGVGYRAFQHYIRQPDAILVLGGAIAREEFAAQFAAEHPNLPIWVSSGTNPEFAELLFAEAGIDPARLHLDYRAVDTVTNFTTLVDEFEQRDIDNIYLITSDYHMRRARVIGEIVFGSHGIGFRPISVVTGEAPEPTRKVMRDGARSVFWMVTGRTGSSLRRFDPRVGRSSVSALDLGELDLGKFDLGRLALPSDPDRGGRELP